MLDTQTGSFIPVKEAELFSTSICSYFVEKKGSAQRTSNRLIEHSDNILKFIKTHNSPTLFHERAEIFIDELKTFIAYHIAVKLGTDFLASKYLSVKPTPEIKKTYAFLEHANKYTDHISPTVTTYFIKLGVSGLLPEELLSLKKYTHKQKSAKSERSLIFISGEKYVFPTSQTKQLYSILQPTTSQKNKQLTTVIKGNSVCKGFAKGKARLIISFDEISEILDGDIIVTQSIRPQHYSYMSKVAAIVTDEGGVLSHAAIIAREKNIPCIVGTRNGTNTITNGALVEVDANKGEVRVIQYKK